MREVDNLKQHLVTNNSFDSLARDRLHGNIARDVWSKSNDKRVGPIHRSGQRVQPLPDLGPFGIIRRLRSQQHRSWMAGSSCIPCLTTHTTTLININ